VTDQSGGGLDLDAVIAEIQRTVEAKTASGVYSASLDDEMRSHYARLLDREDGRDRFHAIHALLERLDAASGFSKSRIDTASDVPGGEFVHKAAGKVVSRQILGLVEQLNDFSGALTPVLKSLASAAEDPRGHTHVDLIHEIDTVQDRLAAVERSVGQISAVVSVLDELIPRLLAHTHALEGVAARVDVLEERARRQAFSPTFSSVAFDDVTRGDAAAIREEYAGLATSLRGVPGPVLDIGAGRGELLELLREQGVDCWGVELDEELVAFAGKNGLDVRLQDGLDALGEQAPGSLGAITLIHVIEHLHPNEFLEVVSLSRETLAVGGKLILETPNPQSLYVYSRAFWLDPTHVRPIHPIYVNFVLQDAGFADPVFEWTATPPTDEVLVELEGTFDPSGVTNENIRRLNRLLFAAQNYRVTATR
jgi:2-polyprenyl-3-methyl-5-hydroxy-6-metoxy-1,4-benzoquinol methylase